MILVKPSHKILFLSPEPLKTIEAAGRTCYKSEGKITDDSAEKFVKENYGELPESQVFIESLLKIIKAKKKKVVIVKEIKGGD